MRLCCRHRAPQHTGKGAKVCEGLGHTACSRRSQAGSEASWLRWGMPGSGGSLCGSLVGSVSRSWWARGAGFSVCASCRLVPSEYGPTTCTYAAVPGSSARRSAQHTARALSTMRTSPHAGGKAISSDRTIAAAGAVHIGGHAHFWARRMRLDGRLAVRLGPRCASRRPARMAVGVKTP